MDLPNLGPKVKYASDTRGENKFGRSGFSTGDECARCLPAGNDRDHRQRLPAADAGLPIGDKGPGGLGSHDLFSR